MKRILLISLLVCTVFFLQAQTIIEKPAHGMSNAGHLEITEIEINSNETVVSFYISSLAGSFGIASKSFIQVVGQPDSLFMTKKTAPKPEANGFIPIPPEGMSYKLYFPPIDPQVSRIDFGEPTSNGWYIYDIEIDDPSNRSMVPDAFLGNWFSEDKNLWEFGFYDSVAVCDMSGWYYQSVDEENGLYTINLIHEGTEKRIYARKGEGPVCWFGPSEENLRQFSNQFPGFSETDFSGYGDANSNDVDPDKGVYCGIIDKFTPRAGKLTGIVSLMNPLTGATEMHIAQVDRYGIFYAEFPLSYPQEVSIRFPGRSDKVFIEPGKKLFHFINATKEPTSNLFMGKSAALNHGLNITRKFEFSQTEFLKEIANMSVREYMAFLQEDKKEKLQELEALCTLNHISEKPYRIRQLGIEYMAAANALQCKSALSVAVFYKNRNQGINEQPELPSVKLSVADLQFLKETQLNHPDALLTREYYTLISALRNTALKDETGAMYKTYMKLESVLEEKNIELSAGEKEMFEYIRLYMKGDNSRDVSGKFSQMYNDTYREVHTKYRDEIQKISNEITAGNLKYNAENIFGISEGLPFDVVETQRYFNSAKEAGMDELTKTYNRARKAIKDEFLKELVMADYYEKRAERKLVEESDGVVLKNDADRFFDSLIKKYRGKVVYVDFWATWCGPCLSGMERIKPLKKELTNEDIVFVYITNPTSGEADYKKMMPGIKGEHYKVSSDEWNLLMSKFNIYGIPHYALVDKKGRIVNGHMMPMENELLKKILLEEANK